MFFKLPDNLPASVIRATFDFYATGSSGGTHHLLAAPLADKSTFIDVPLEATHLHAIRFHNEYDAFTYYYPSGGYPLAEGGILPPLLIPAVGESYAGGLVIQNGQNNPDGTTGSDLVPFQGKIIAYHEHTATYSEGETYCRQLARQTGIPWELPELTDLLDLHHRQASVDRLLLQNGGSPLTANTYWCRDNSVVELGISFHLTTAHYAIEKKTEEKQIRPLACY